MAVRFEYSKIKVFIFNVVELETVSVFSSIKLVYSFRGKNVNAGGNINQSIYLITPDFFSWVDLFYLQLLPLFFIDYLSTSFSTTTNTIDLFFYLVVVLIYYFFPDLRVARSRQSALFKLINRNDNSSSTLHIH